MLGNQLFGEYRPGSTPVHKAPLWSKAVFLLLISLLLMFNKVWWVALICLIGIICIGKLGHIGFSSWLPSFKPLIPLFLILAAYYFLWMKQVNLGCAVLLTMLTLIACSRVLLTTTPIPRIIDGFVKLCTPLKFLGVPPERIGLAIALMIRSIPVIMNEYTLIQEAHRARGISPWPHRMLIPLVLATVAYAQETGDALAARGLDQHS